MQKSQQWRSTVPVNVFIADASQLICQLIRSALSQRHHHVTVVGSANGSGHAVPLLDELKPDVALISAQLEEGPLEGYRVLDELRSLQSKTRAVMLLHSRERELVIDAFRFGAHGVVFRDEGLETIGKCIHAVHQGQVWANSQHLGYILEALSRSTPAHLWDARGLELLSKRQEEVARLVAEGLTNREVSEQLRLSEHTVRNYLFQIFDKLGVSTRVELVLYCLQQRHRSPLEAADQAN